MSPEHTITGIDRSTGESLEYPVSPADADDIIRKAEGLPDPELTDADEVALEAEDAS
jgi:hypothetical protein